MISNMKHTKNLVIARGKQFLFLIEHPPCYSNSLIGHPPCYSYSLIGHPQCYSYSLIGHPPCYPSSLIGQPPCYSYSLIGHPPCYSYILIRTPTVLLIQSCPVKVLSLIEERQIYVKWKKIHCHLKNEHIVF
jgi:hypothetical protein